MEHCPICLGREVIGDAAWQRDGREILLRADCPMESGMIYRLVLQSGKQELRLGVMLPREGRFYLERKFHAAAEPEAVYIDRTLPGEEHLPGLPLALSAFQPVEEAELWGVGTNGLRCAWWRDTCYYLFPLYTDQPCPFVPLFCLTTPVEQSGRRYGVLCRRGERYLPLSDSLCTGGGV